MRKTLIYCQLEYIGLARDLRNNYLAHNNADVDIVSEEAPDDIEYARKMQYDEVIIIEDNNTVIIHDIKSGYTNRCHVSDVYYKDQ